jgi:hypothetical protein
MLPDTPPVSGYPQSANLPCPFIIGWVILIEFG